MSGIASRKIPNRQKIFLWYGLSFFMTALCLAEGTGAGFLKISAGARAVGMGSAFTAVADDASALYWNPAGISDIPNRQVLAMHSPWLLDMNYEFASYVQPTRFGGMGVGLSYLSQGTFEGRNDDRRPTGDFSASDLAAVLGIASPWKLGGLGINLKFIQQRIESEQATGLALDLGSYIQPLDAPFTLGLVLQNAGPGMKFFDEAYSLPLTLSAGAAYDLGGFMTVSADVRRRLYTGNTSVSIGTEFWLFNTVALRSGYLGRVGAFTNSGLRSNADSRLERLTGLGAGMGIRLHRYQVDYAIEPYGELGSTHRISLTANF
jgi:hypothetical protein